MPAKHRMTTKLSPAHGFELAQQLFYVWKCPDCTWFRMRTNREWWEKKMIQHPFYGRINNYDLFKREIEDHDCTSTAAARQRFNIDPTADTLEKYRSTYYDDRT